MNLYLNMIYIIIYGYSLYKHYLYFWNIYIIYSIYISIHATRTHIIWTQTFVSESINNDESIWQHY